MTDYRAIIREFDPAEPAADFPHWSATIAGRQGYAAAREQAMSLAYQWGAEHLALAIRNMRQWGVYTPPAAPAYHWLGRDGE